MRSFGFVVAGLIKYRGSHCSAVAVRLGTEMCKEPKTKLLRLYPPTSNGPTVHQETQTDDSEVLSCTVKALKDGHIVAVPTDTIYGLACLAQNSEAVKKIYEVKERNGQKPLAICVGEIRDIYQYCKVKVKEGLLGVRIPDHAFMRRLCQMCGEPLALTSANISSTTSTVEVHEFQELWSKLAVVVDGGPIGDETRQGSTVIDLSVLGKYRVIRPGCALSATLDVLEHKYGLSENSKEE